MTDDEVVVLTDEQVSLVRQLADARLHRGEWEKLEGALRKQVLQAVKGGGDGEQAITASGTPVARISTSVRHSVDSKKLEALYPEVYAAVVKETTIEKLDIL